MVVEEIVKFLNQNNKAYDQEKIQKKVDKKNKRIKKKVGSKKGFENEKVFDI